MVLPLDEELLVFDSCWERENQIFCLSYGRAKTPQSRCHTQEVFTTQTGPDIFLKERDQEVGWGAGLGREDSVTWVLEKFGEGEVKTIEIYEIPK